VSVFVVVYEFQLYVCYAKMRNNIFEESNECSYTEKTTLT